MELTLRRVAKKATYTIGKLYINGKYFCDTVEDCDRGLSSDMPEEEIQKKKVYSQTAIPTGTYPITMNVVSPKYSKKLAYKWCGARLPRLLNLKAWSGVLIHAGNTAADSAGCILVGKNTEVGKVTNSMNTLKKLWPLLDAASKKGEKINITIK